MDFEKKTKSKAYYFFDKLFRTFICNILCVASMAIPVAIFILLLIDLGRYGADAKMNVDDMNKLMILFWIASAKFIATFPFLILPSLVASTDVLKDGLSGTNVFRAWLYAFRRYYVKSMLLGLIYSVLFSIILLEIEINSFSNSLSSPG